jgi:serine/threonine-protein kinase
VPQDASKAAKAGAKLEPIRRRLGRYEFIMPIGVGGMAECFLARQRGMMNFEKLVVVKTIHPHLARQPKFIEMLLDEARVSALIKHSNVVDIYDLGKEDVTYFIAMEYLQGQPLSAVITSGRRLRRPIDAHSTVRIIADAASGLHAAHELKSMAGDHLGLIHRDVSPGNIVVLYDGQVKLVDFGVSKARGSISTDDDRELKGKLGYTAPELLDGVEANRQSDIFALGVVMWEALTLRRLYRAPTESETVAMIRAGKPRPPSAHRREVSAELDKICLRAIASDTIQRYQTARDLQTDLENLLRRVAYHREAKGIETYMKDVFADKVAEEREMIKRATELAPTSLPPDGAECEIIDVEDANHDIGDVTNQVVTPEARQARKKSIQPAGLSLPLPAPDEPAAELDSASGRAITSSPIPDDDDMEMTLDAEIPPLTPTPTPAPTPASAAMPPTDMGAALIGLDPSQISIKSSSGSAKWIVIGLLVVGVGIGGFLLASGGGGENNDDVSVSDQPKKNTRSTSDGTDEHMDDETREMVEAFEAEEARKKAEEAKARTRSLAEKLQEEGEALMKKKKYDDAQTKFQNALRSDDTFGPAYRGLGDIYYKRKDKQAIYLYEKYLALTPDAPDAKKIKRRLKKLK